MIQEKRGRRNKTEKKQHHTCVATREREVNDTFVRSPDTKKKWKGEAKNRLLRGFVAPPLFYLGLWPFLRMEKKVVNTTGDSACVSIF